MTTRCRPVDAGPTHRSRFADVSESSGQPEPRDLARWSASLAGIARTGLAFTENLYERERYEEVLHVAADIRAAAEMLEDAAEVERETDHFVQEWLQNIGEGVPGYVTPKVAIGAVVGNDDGEILLVQRADSGIWLYPTGWADIGYSASEVAVKEVAEETGINCEPVRLLSVIDGQRMGFSRFGMYMLLFFCRATGGDLRPHPLETSDVGWFGAASLPEATAGASWWAPMAFAAINGEEMPTAFDQPRDRVWRR
jgi:ADP-ribose pyrophosphatase YjhB (NUDIX family)